MKREKFLWPLSQSHHRALLAARRIKESLTNIPLGEENGRVRKIFSEVQELFDQELRQHFRDEEEMMEVFEKHVPGDPDVGRLLEDHRQLESLGSKGERESLLEFAKILVAHVRFEEDTLFGKVERSLDLVEKDGMGRILDQHISKG